MLISYMCLLTEAHKGYIAAASTACGRETLSESNPEPQLRLQASLQWGNTTIISCITWARQYGYAHSGEGAGWTSAT